jgi:inositol 1,4,5-triphosphate receptor type 1
MHDYPPLVSGALHLLFRHFSQRQEVLHAFRQVQLLVSDQDVESYKQIKNDLDVLRQCVEKSELWVYKSRNLADEDQTPLPRLDETGDADGPPLFPEQAQEYTKIQDILIRMNKLCIQSVPGGLTKPRKHEQRLLRNVGVHTIVLDLLQVPYDEKDDTRMNKLMQLAHQFLQNFCLGNQHNQVNIKPQLRWKFVSKSSFRVLAGSSPQAVGSLLESGKSFR